MQSELLQLHIIHRDAHAIDAQWRTSAREKLGERFAKAVDDNTGLVAKERDAVEAANASVLKAWLSCNANIPNSDCGRPGAGSRVTHWMEEKLQALDSVLIGLWTVGETGGKYARVVRKFERWVEKAEEAMEMRSRSRCGSGIFTLLDANPDLNMKDYYNEIFVGGLDDGWKEECAILYRKLDGWRRTLKNIGELPEDAGMENSALGKILTGCRETIHDMLLELDAMESIERDAAAAENDWVKRVNREDDEARDGERRAGGIWRHV